MSVPIFLIKPLVSAGVAVALDVFYMKETSISRSLTLGGSVATGVYLGSMVGDIVPEMDAMPDVLGNGKGLFSRVAEVGSSVASSFLINKYVLKNTSYREDLMQKVGVIVVADLVGEVVSDFLAGQPIMLLA